MWMSWRSGPVSLGAASVCKQLASTVLAPGLLSLLHMRLKPIPWQVGQCLASTVT